MAHDKRFSPERRRFLVGAGAGVAALALFPRPARGAAAMISRKIPHGAEAIPVIGLGTYDTFDVSGGESARAPLVEVMRSFIDAGGRLVDSSPMYGAAERTVGEVLGALGRPPMFLATKVWTRGKAEGVKQMTESMQKMGAGPKGMALMQIHNLVDWKTHLATLRDWKTAGKIRYIGITHYDYGAFGEMEAIIRKEKIDFVQLPYSLQARDAEKRLLPAAAETGTAVIVMRPFEKGGLFNRVKGKPLPDWAAEIDCASWAQLFLKFIVAHPAVTCTIPATSNPKHLADNVLAGVGRLPDEAQRKKLVEWFES